MNRMSVLDYINEVTERIKAGISLDEFTEAMRSGDQARKEDAVERMLDAGGYENLE